MAAYKEEAGAILQPGNQINRLSSYNTEGVYGWPGVEAFELIGYVKVDNLSADKASYKSFDIIVPSPDRRPDDRVRDNRTSLVVQASAARPAYVYGASIAIAQDIPAGGLAGFPASPVTADIGDHELQHCVRFNPVDVRDIVSNGQKTVIFWNWTEEKLAAFHPPKGAPLGGCI